MMVSSECKRQEPTEHGSRQTLTRAGGGQTTKLESSLSLSLFIFSLLLTPLFLLPSQFKNTSLFFMLFFSLSFNFPLLVLEADQMMKCNLPKSPFEEKIENKISVKKLLSDRDVLDHPIDVDLDVERKI